MIVVITLRVLLHGPKWLFTIRGSPDRRPERFGVRWLGTALYFKLAE